MEPMEQVELAFKVSGQAFTDRAIVGGASAANAKFLCEARQWWDFAWDIMWAEYEREFAEVQRYSMCPHGIHISDSSW